MTTNMPPKVGSNAGAPLRPLIDRVRDRVTEAGAAHDRRPRASRIKSVRARRPRAAQASTLAQSPDAAREAHSLRRVFRDMGDTYHQYRRETGRPVTPGLRDATEAFKKAPTLLSLVAVAAFLDELGILPW
jgi:hypothetical protein